MTQLGFRLISSFFLTLSGLSRIGVGEGGPVLGSFLIDLLTEWASGNRRHRASKDEGSKCNYKNEAALHLHLSDLLTRNQITLQCSRSPPCRELSSFDPELFLDG